MNILYVQNSDHVVLFAKVHHKCSRGFPRRVPLSTKIDKYN